MKRGEVVCSIKGHDKDNLAAVMSVENNAVFISDGKQRKVAQPKRKNPKHVRSLNLVLSEYELEADSRLRKALNRVKKTD